MADKENCVVRIVNLDDSFTEEVLKSFILLKCQPQGDIIKIYLSKCDELNIFYGYIIFEHSYDASKTVAILNGYIHISNKLEAELIGPDLHYRKYIETYPQRGLFGKIKSLQSFNRSKTSESATRPRARSIFGENIYIPPNGIRNVDNSKNSSTSKYIPPWLRMCPKQ